MDTNNIVTHNKECIINHFNTVLLDSKYDDIYQTIVDYYGEDRVGFSNFENWNAYKIYLVNTFKSYVEDSQYVLELINSYSDYSNEDFIIKCESLIHSFLKRYYNPICVYFPKVLIKNENDAKHTIYDLYVEIPISLISGCLKTCGLRGIRTTFTMNEWQCGYSHSHLPKRISDIPECHYFCTGSGPINNTISYLLAENSIDNYMLFCYELDKFVTIESLSGGPYISINRIREGEKLDIYKYFKRTKHGLSNLSVRKEFVKYLLNKKVINFIFSNGIYQLGMSLEECILKVSNTYIEFINDYLIPTKTYDIREACWELNYNGYNLSFPRDNESVNVERLNTQVVTKFKGKNVNLKIIENKIDNVNTITALNMNIVGSIITYLLEIINYYAIQSTENQIPGELF